MKFAILDEPVQPSLSARVPELDLDQFDFVLALKPSLSDHPKVMIIDEVSQSSFDADLRLIDEWATTVADAIHLNGRPVTFPVREVYRVCLASKLSDQFGGIWLPLTDWLDNNAHPGDEVTLISSRLLLANALSSHLKRCGFDFHHVSEQRQQSKDTHQPLTSLKQLLKRNSHSLQVRLKRLLVRKRRLATIRTLRKVASSGKPVVIFYLHHYVHYQILRRVTAILKQWGYEILLVDWGSGSVRSNQDRMSDPVIYLWDLRPNRRESAEQAAQIEFSNLSQGDDWLGASQDYRDEISKSLAGATRHLSYHVGVHQALWSHLHPVALIACDEFLNGSCLGVAAQEAGIPCVDVAHALQQPFRRNYAYTAVALFGQDNVDAHRHREIPPSSCTLVPVGACRYDDIFLQDHPGESRIRSELGISSEAQIVCFASFPLNFKDQRLVQLKRQTLHWLMESLPPEAVLVVKKHPGESDDICETTLSSDYDAGRYRVTQTINLYGLLAISNVVITLWSNVATEALLCRKQVILISTTIVDVSEYWPYVRYGVALQVNNQAELSRAIRNSLRASEVQIKDFESRRQDFIRDCLVAFDGRASERVARLVQHLVHGKQAQDFVSEAAIHA